MQFIVLERYPTAISGAPESALLVKDPWDDWGKYDTRYKLFVFDEAAKSHPIGLVKIGQAGLAKALGSSPGFRSPTLPTEPCERLPEGSFSLGQSDDYYELIGKLPSGLREKVLEGMCDCVHNYTLFEQYREEEVMGESLLRYVSAASIATTFLHLSRGHDKLTPFDFYYSFPEKYQCSDQMRFKVVPNSLPPTNVHAVIGGNGVGKTKLLQNIIRTVLLQEERNEKYGSLETELSESSDDFLFKNVIFVSFSAFDQPTFPGREELSVNFTHVGPAGIADRGAEDQAIDFLTTLELCSEGLQKERLLDALQILATDHLFPIEKILSLIEERPEWSDAHKAKAEKIYKRLSSGHAIALSIVTYIAFWISERSLLVFDEPESHLHPPLLSSLVRCISEMLVKKNGVAILATHSPVVLQEVPRSCVWKLSRRGRKTGIARPRIETFGENVSALTHEVFSLELRKTGFYTVLESEVDKVPQGEDVYDEVSWKFHARIRGDSAQLGSEAKAVLLALASLRDEEQ